MLLGAEEMTTGPLLAPGVNMVAVRLMLEARLVEIGIRTRTKRWTIVMEKCWLQVKILVLKLPQ